MSNEISSLFDQLSVQGKKRVESYAKFILDEEKYSQDVKVVTALIKDLKHMHLWSRVELGEVNAEHVEEVQAKINNQLASIDFQNFYRPELEKLQHSCHLFLEGDISLGQNIIDKLKDFEYIMET